MLLAPTWARKNPNQVTLVPAASQPSPTNTKACIGKEKSGKFVKMNQRRAGNVRPSGTDGSDFSFRMVVDSRYKKATQFRSRLSRLIFIQALIQLIGLIFLFLSKSKEEELDKIALSSFVVCFISLLIGELGRKLSKVNYLRIFMYGSSLSLMISIAKALTTTYVLQVIKDFSSWNSSTFELAKVSTLILGLVAQIFVLRTTVSLGHNMAPPKRTS